MTMFFSEKFIIQRQNILFETFKKHIYVDYFFTSAKKKYIYGGYLCYIKDVKADQI